MFEYPGFSPDSSGTNLANPKQITLNKFQQTEF